TLDGVDQGKPFHLLRADVASATADALAPLRPEGRPGTVLLAGTGPDVPLAAGLLAALGDGAVRVALLTPSGPLADPGLLRWRLPRWAGPLDVVVITSADGSEDGLVELLDQAHRRGCALASVAPADSPLAEATARRRGPALRATTADHLEPADHPAAPGGHWPLLTATLMLGHRLGVCEADDAAIDALADRLDATAERCGPVVPTQENPAKSLAVGCEGTLPLLWSEGEPAAAVAGHAVRLLHALPGVPALTSPLPWALAAHAALLTAERGGAAKDDFFRDRADDEPELRPRVVLLGSPAPADLPPGDDSAPRAAAAARALALRHGVPFGELTAAEGGPLEATGELLAQLDFTAVYLTLTATARS
ncbi:SIS domain-containing protein, partial [Streptomyces spiramenti]